MNNAIRLLSVMLVMALLAGCATGPGIQAPARAQLAIDANNRGAEQLASGDYPAAQQHFRQALLIAESLEDEDAIAANLINLARVQQRLGDHAAATASLDRVLLQSRLDFPAARLTEAALQRALFAVERGRHDEASRFARMGEGWCQARCPQHGKLLALRGYLALAAGDAAEAEQAARAAVGFQRERNDAEELANGLRVLGLALLATGKADKAIGPLREALALDKRQAVSRAIVNDLIALGRAHGAIGDAEAATGYFERAQTAAIADGNKAGAHQAKREMQRRRVR
jgi:tetratricopeptide (TPR) repeat protein